MKIDRENKYTEQKVIINPWIHKQSTLSKEDFLKRIKNVKSIRTRLNDFSISIYITSLDEFNNLNTFHKIINNGIFPLENSPVFAIAVQPELYNWFKSKSVVQIQKQILCWIAGLVFFNPDNNIIYKKQLYPPMYEEVHKIIKEYYSEFNLPNFKSLKFELFKNNNELYFEERDRCVSFYQNVCSKIYGDVPPEILASPFEYFDMEKWGLNKHFNFEFIEAYFTQKDWGKILLGESQDELSTTQSNDHLWMKWKHTYISHNETKSFLYSFIFEEPIQKLKHSKRREVIPQNVKDKVWNRDLGECVQCGSNEKLEFDHIIPIKKGGASSYRNIQLLCEPCNRKKSSNI